MSTAAPQRRVAIILVNYRDYARTYLAACYASLMAQTYPRSLTTLLIVDNASSAQTQQVIATAAPTARLIPCGVNGGWAEGNNVAIRAALEEGMDDIVLLNMDTVVEPQWLSALVEEAEQWECRAIVQSTIRLFGSDRIHSVGNRIHFLGFGYCLGYGQREEAAPHEPMDFASGASMLVPRQIFERIGLFRSDYFMYYDDLEFCWRARLAGYEVGRAERSVCHHKYSFDATMRWLYYLQRNRWLTMLTLARWRTLLLLLPCSAAAELVLTGYFMLRGRLGTQWRALRELARPSTWRLIRARRCEIRRLRVRRDAQLVAGFSGRIIFAEVHHRLVQWVANPLLEAYWALARCLIVW